MFYPYLIILEGLPLYRGSMSYSMGRYFFYVVLFLLTVSTLFTVRSATLVSRSVTGLEIRKTAFSSEFLARNGPQQPHRHETPPAAQGIFFVGCAVLELLPRVNGRRTTKRQTLSTTLFLTIEKDHVGRFISSWSFCFKRRIKRRGKDFPRSKQACDASPRSTCDRHFGSAFS